MRSARPSQDGLTRRAALAGLGAAVAAGAAPRVARGEIVDFVVIGKDGWLFPIFDGNRTFKLADMDPVIDCINQAVAILKRGGVATAIALTPAKSRIYADYLPADFKPTPDAEKRYASAREAIGKAGTLIPDLASIMLGLRRSAPATPVFLKADTHWTGEGAEACATYFAAQVKAHIPLPPSPGPGTQLGPLKTFRQTTNDLADGLPDAQAAKYQPQSFAVRTVQQSGAEGLLDEGSSDVLLVGNSFMQPKYGFAPMLSNQLGRPVSLQWRVHQLSVYKTLLAALNSDAWRRTKPKLLVWDFEETDMSATPDEAGVWGPNAIKVEDFLSQLRQAVGVSA